MKRNLMCVGLIMLLVISCIAAGVASTEGEDVSIAQGESIVLNNGKTEILKLNYSKAVKAARKTITWASEDEKIATVNEKGLVTAIANGETNIICTVELKEGQKFEANCAVRVQTPVTAIHPEKEELIVGIGQTIPFIYSVEPGNASNTTISWMMENESIAYLKDGAITGVSAGHTHLIGTAEDESGTRISCNVTVSSLYSDTGSLLIDSLVQKEFRVYYKGVFAEGYTVTIEPAIANCTVVVEEGESAGYIDPGEERCCIVKIHPLAVGNAVLTVKNNENQAETVSVNISITEEGLPNSQKLVISQAELISNANMLTYRFELVNNSSQEIGEIGFLVDYRDQFRDTHYCFSNSDGTIQSYRYTTRLNILPGAASTLAGRSDSFRSSDLITEVRLAICYYRYVESAEKVYIPDSQLYWFSTKTGEMEKPEITENYKAPEIEITDKAERISLGATTCELYTYVSKSFARSYRPGKYLSIIGKDSNAEYWGMEARDVIYGADGNLWENDPFFLERAFADLYDGKTVQLMVVRNGEEIEISAAKKPKETPAPETTPETEKANAGTETVTGNDADTKNDSEAEAVK